MKKRNIYVGMPVKHAQSGKPMGVVKEVGRILVVLDPYAIATPAELEPA